MSFIEQLEKISAKIFQQSIKTYKLKDIIAHKRATPKSLVEYLSMFPNKGLGFHIRKKSWRDNHYIKITSTQYKSHRFGKIRGMQYYEGKEDWKMPKKINGTSKRGIWTFSVGQAKEIELDNGLLYSAKDFEAYMQFRKRYDPKPVAQTAQQETQNQGQTSQAQQSQPQPEQPQK